MPANDTALQSKTDFKPAKRRKRIRLQYKLILFAAIITLVTLELSGILIYMDEKRQLQDLHAKELLAVVNSISPFISGDDHESIFAPTYGEIEGQDEFDNIRQVLLTTKASNQLDVSSKGSPLYTLRPSMDFEVDGLLEFVVMTDTDDEGLFFTGNMIAAEPHHLKALAGASIATSLYHDAEGTWISAAAPIRDSEGMVVGIVQADRYVAFYHAQIVESIYKLLFVAVISLIVGMVIALFFSIFFTRSINKLVVATQKLASGNLDVCLDIQSGDEIEDLAYHFNVMVKKLNRSMRDQKNKAKMLKQKNDEIATLNKSLEEKVARRTASLKASNQELENTLQELQESQAKLLQSEKMASLGQIAAGVAHEINNPIGFIGSNIDTQKEYVQSISEVHQAALALFKEMKTEEIDTESTETADTQIGDRLQLLTALQTFQTCYHDSDIDFIIEDSTTLLNETTDGVTRIADIVSNLKTFSRIDDSGISEININDCIDNTLKIVNNELKYNCTIEKRFGDVSSVMVNAGEINQVLLNILINAGQAIEDEGVIEITTAELDAEVVITIEDNGKGIPEDKLSKIFDPFFTTKPVGEGTGLGLAISYDIIAKHHGTIEVDSQLNQGTCFTIRLPKQSATSELPNQASPLAAA